MLFNSAAFLLGFLPVVLAIFLVIGRSSYTSLRVVWLLAASMFFYAWWSLWFLGLLVASMIINWGLGRLIDVAEGPRRKMLLIAGLVWNLALLGWFKYVDFFLDSFNGITGSHFPMLRIVLPLGISFFTFQKIAYLVDVHRRLARPASLMNFSLFVFFFPQLIAGPIVHHSELMPQIDAMSRAARDREKMWTDLAVGYTLLAIGLFKKVVVADQLGTYATPVFEAASGGASLGAIAAWAGALGYAGQLYFDFSGYCDMAIGLARMFGVTLPANFDSPYQATSIIEFWRRWHMTLSRFLRDYLYIPLGGGRKGSVRRHVNLMATMLLGGFWHGAGWTFILWGGLHGLYLIVAHLWREHVGWALHPLLGWSMTILSVTVAWVFFRASTPAEAILVFKGMVFLNGLDTGVRALDRIDGLALALAALAAAALLPNSMQIMRHFNPVLGPVRGPSQLVTWIDWRPSRTAVVAATISLIAVLTFSWGSSEFLYFQF